MCNSTSLIRKTNTCRVFWPFVILRAILLDETTVTFVIPRKNITRI